MCWIGALRRESNPESIAPAFSGKPGRRTTTAHQGFPSKVLALSCLYLFILKFIIVVILIFIIFIMFVVLIILLILLMLFIIIVIFDIKQVVLAQRATAGIEPGIYCPDIF